MATARWLCEIGGQPTKKNVPAIAACLLLVCCAGQQNQRAAPATTGGKVLASEPLLRIEAGMHTATIMSISADAEGRYAVTAGLDKSARVWDMATGRLLQVLRTPIDSGNEGLLYAVSISPDGQTVAVGGSTGYRWEYLDSVYLFDRASGRLSKRLSGLPEAVNHLAFSPDGRYLAAALFRGGLRVWPLTRGDDATPMVDGDYQDQSYAVTWAGNNRLATSCYDGKIRLYLAGDDGLQRTASIIAPGGKQPYGLAFSPDGRELAVGYSDSHRVDILDAQTLAPKYSPEIEGVANGNLSKVAWSADGASLLAGGQWHPHDRFPIRRWPQSGRGAPVDVLTTSNSIRDLHPLPDGRILLAAFDPAWGVLEPSRTGEYSWHPVGEPPIADLRDNYRGFAVSADASQVQFSFEQWGRSPYHFDIARRRMIPGDDSRLISPATQGLDIRDWRNSFTPNVAGHPLQLDAYETSRSFALAPGGTGFALGAEWSLRYFDSQGHQLWRKTAPGVVWAVNIPPSGRVVVAACNDGTIRWYRLSDGQELLAFFPHADRKRWVLWTPAGYYDSSPDGEELLGWHFNHGLDQAADFYSAGKFRNRYRRPDIIDHVLDTLDEGSSNT